MTASQKLFLKQFKTTMVATQGKSYFGNSKETIETQGNHVSVTYLWKGKWGTFIHFHGKKKENRKNHIIATRFYCK